MNFPKVTLSNGLRLANLSSPHSFTFVDGSTLEACSREHTNALPLESVEVEIPNRLGWVDISLEFRMTAAVQAALTELEADASVDIVIVPFPVITALKSAGMPVGKARTCRIPPENRVNKLARIDAFCA